MICIYVLKDPITGDIKYVGATKNLRKRFPNHLTNIRREPDNPRVVWIKELLAVGLRPVPEIIDEVPIEEGQMWEVAYVQYYKDCGCDLVNETAGGPGTLGASERIRKIQSARHSGKNNPMFGLTGENHPAFGFVHTAEMREKNSKALLGKPKTPEHVANLSKIWTPERRAEMGAKMKRVRANKYWSSNASN